MADSSSPIRPSSSSKTPPQKSQQNPTTPFSNFIYKAVFVCVLVALLPIFPSHPPEPANKTVLARSWELLHLLLVGIAISYGLFSRRNSDHDADGTTTPHSCVSRAPHVPPVFEDEETKTQTWNYSQYNPGEPVVMVAKETSTADGSKASTKPLFLPVRSLRSTQGEDDDDDDDDGVLPSPVPWRSRSGRMEVKEAPSSPPISSPQAELGPSRLSEIRAKISEDLGRRKSFNKPSPPPPSPPSPPPPPPLPLVHGHNIATERKDEGKSFKYELEHSSMRGRGRGRGRFLPHSDGLGLGPPAPADNGPYGGRQRQRSRRTLPTTRRSKKKDEFREKMIIESDSSDSSDDAESDGELPNSAPAAAEEENEVDKKADEFISKFREQIRLQRISSIKRSTAQQRNVTSRS